MFQKLKFLICCKMDNKNGNDSLILPKFSSRSLNWYSKSSNNKIKNSTLTIQEEVKFYMIHF